MYLLDPASERNQPATHTFYVAREDQVDSPDLQSVADALGAAIGLAPGEVIPLIPMERQVNQDILKVRSPKSN
jgi:hypothetical protein